MEITILTLTFNDPEFGPIKEIELHTSLDSAAERVRLLMKNIDSAKPMTAYEYHDQPVLNAFEGVS